MNVIPCPDMADVPVNEIQSATLDAGQKATFTFEPGQASSTFRLPTVGISKNAQTEYEVKVDGQDVFGPAAAPPTDVDDIDVTFMPAREFQERLVVIVRNLSASTTNRYICQILGWEVSD